MTRTSVPNHALADFKPGRLLAALAVTAAAACAAAFPAASQARTTTCKPPSYPGSGYYTSLKASGTSCSTANKVLRAYYKCRTKKGKSGRCTSKVEGYRCTETRKSIPTEFNARVTCKRGSAKVQFTYQQNL
jgi:hypothetical protein